MESGGNGPHPHRLRLPMNGKESTSSAYGTLAQQSYILPHTIQYEKRKKNKANPTTRTAARRRRSRLPSDVSVARVVPCAAPRDHAFSPASARPSGLAVRRPSSHARQPPHSFAGMQLLG